MSRTDNSADRGKPLNALQKHVLEDYGTERPGSSALLNEKRPGDYLCARCGTSLFASEAKYESGSGWPSFWDVKGDAVGTHVDHRHGMTRTEVHCASCEGHLGHVFPDGPRPSGLRYCINGAALAFEPASDK